MRGARHGQQSEDERSARAEDREPLIDVPRDHVRGHDPAKRPGRWVRNGPPHRTRDPISCEHQCLHRPHRETGHRTHEGEVSSADPVVDEGRSRDQADSHPHDRRRDPEPGDPPPQNEPLRRSDDCAHDESTGERCSNGIDPVHDQVCDVPRDREADQDRYWPQPHPTRLTRQVASRRVTLSDLARSTPIGRLSHLLRFNSNIHELSLRSDRGARPVGSIRASSGTKALGTERSSRTARARWRMAIP